MDDTIFVTEVFGNAKVYISPIHHQTYEEFVAGDSLGGNKGYFVMRECEKGLEVLAKAASLEAAQTLFDLIARGRKAVA